MFVMSNQMPRSSPLVNCMKSNMEGSGSSGVGGGLLRAFAAGGQEIARSSSKLLVMANKLI